MKTRISLIVSLAFALICVFGATPAQAQVDSGLLLTVNSTADAVDAQPGDGICATTGGQCTLRAAIDEANVYPAHDVIIFDLQQPAVIDLTLGELQVERYLDIAGPGARRLTVRRSSAVGTPNFGIFHVPANQTVLTIRGITIQNGNASSGGGVFVEPSSTLSLYDSALIGNRAAAGGGAAAAGRLIIVRCLIQSNIADNQGGAILNAGSGAETTIASSTITGNSASIGGAIENQGPLWLVHDTISGNNASITSSSILNGPLGTITVLNTIIGRDVGQSVPALQGAFQSAGNNIVTNLGQATGFANGVNGDQVSQNNAIDPLLGDLANNGGQTDTLLPLTGSPAIGNANVCTSTPPCSLYPDSQLFSARNDQRRLRRRLLLTELIDIGAVETDGTVRPYSGPTTIGFFGLTSRFATSLLILVDTTTLERRYGRIGLTGSARFIDLPRPDVADVVEVKAKRFGLNIETPTVISFDF